MTQKNIELVLTQIFENPEFREQFDMDRKSSLNNFELTHDETAALMQINVQELLDELTSRDTGDVHLPTKRPH